MSYVRMLASSIMNMLVFPDGNYAIDASATMLTHTERISFWVHSLIIWLCGAYGQDVSFTAQNAEKGEAVISPYCTSIYVSRSLHKFGG